MQGQNKQPATSNQQPGYLVKKYVFLLNPGKAFNFHQIFSAIK